MARCNCDPASEKVSPQAIEIVHPSQCEIVCGEAVRATPKRASKFRGADTRYYSRDHSRHYLVLDVKQFAVSGVNPVAPYTAPSSVSRRSTDIRRPPPPRRTLPDSRTVPPTLRPTIQACGHRRSRPPESGTPRKNDQFPQSPERDDHILHDTRGEIQVLDLPPKVGEWQNGDGRHSG